MNFSFLQTAQTLDDVQSLLSNLQTGAVIFLDVDDTLITPQSNLFRTTSPFRTIIDQIKARRDNIPNVDMILSHWRLQRKVRLVADGWPAYIDELKKKYPVYALTKLESGRIGAIPSMEEWRYNELKKYGITFTPTCPGIRDGTLVEDPTKPYPATFYKGIFVTGSFNKSHVIEAFLKTQHPSKIVLIDDRIEYLQDAMAECQRQALPFLGILFKGTEHIPGTPDPKIAALQEQHLLDHAQWLEDEEADEKK